MTPNGTRPLITNDQSDQVDGSATGALLSLTAKTGEPFLLKPASSADLEPLVDMYDHHVPKKESQGLPPDNSQVRRDWLRGLLDHGENFLVLKDDKVFGHSVILPDMVVKNAEFVIFVHLEYRSRGLGTALTRAAIQRARDLGLEIVWLTVETFNFRATGLYRKVGFKFSDDEGIDRIMILTL